MLANHCEIFYALVEWRKGYFFPFFGEGCPNLNEIDICSMDISSSLQIDAVRQKWFFLL